MPVFNFDFNRSVTNVDLAAARSGIFTPTIDSLELRDDKLRRFNELVRRVAPGRTAFEADQIAGAARRVLRAAMKGQDSVFIETRMRRAGEIRAALADAQWHAAPALLDTMREIVAYLDAGEAQLIPNTVPVVGLLDDAILIDSAMDALRAELDDYADFCRYRIAVAANLGIAPDAARVDRQRWHADRQRELRLEQQLRRLRGPGGGNAPSRIC